MLGIALWIRCLSGIKWWGSQSEVRDRSHWWSLHFYSWLLYIWRNRITYRGSALMEITVIPLLIPYPLTEGCYNILYSAFSFHRKLTVRISAHHCFKLNKHKWWHMVRIPIWSQAMEQNHWRTWKHTRSLYILHPALISVSAVRIWQKTPAIPHPLLK